MAVGTSGSEYYAATGQSAGRLGSRPSTHRGFGWLALTAAVYTYALIVFGGIVRITGSGMGCGDDWPRCNGEWIPAFDLATLIEYTHRLLAAGLGFVVLAVVVAAIRRRRDRGFRGPDGPFRPALAASGLLIVQVLLGAVTVKLELPASTTVLHFGVAMLLLASLLVAAARGFHWGRAKPQGAAAVDEAQPTAGTVDRHDHAQPAVGTGDRHDHAGTFRHADAAAIQYTASRSARAATAAATLGFVVVLFGALTANTGAAPLCQGFPLCNGQLVPTGGSLVHVHWTHRLLAFLLFFHVVGAAVLAWRRDAVPAVVRGATASLVLIVVQVALAAALVLLELPPLLQSFHLAVGAAIWTALVAWAAAARRAARDVAGWEARRVEAVASQALAALDRTEGA